MPLNKTKLHVGIDLLGCDTPADQLLQPLLDALKSFPQHITFSLFVTSDLMPLIPPMGRVQGIVPGSIISMDEDPLLSLRKKKDSSTGLGIQQLQEGRFDAFISAGNTGALIAFATHHLGMLPSIDRPALLTLLPTKDTMMAVVDVGANVHCSAELLVQFARMGAAFQRCHDIEMPRVGLLNIGSEKKKGGPTLQEAYQLLSTLWKEGPRFVGNVEGREAFYGTVDVLVTEGFAGNIFLKTSEGIAAVILEGLEAGAEEECSPFLKEALAQIRQKLYFAEYPGALLAGIDRIVLKCHGASTISSFLHSLKEALRLLETDFMRRFSKQLQTYS